MADIDLDRDRQRERDRMRERDRTRERHEVKVYDRTETRRSLVTTEFWLTVVAIAGLLVTGYADDNGLGPRLAWMLSAGVLAAYLISRGIAKAGSHDPHVHEIRYD